MYFPVNVAERFKNAFLMEHLEASAIDLIKKWGEAPLTDFRNFQKNYFEN